MWIVCTIDCRVPGTIHYQVSKYGRRVSDSIQYLGTHPVPLLQLLPGPPLSSILTTPFTSLFLNHCLLDTFIFLWMVLWLGLPKDPPKGFMVYFCGFLLYSLSYLLLPLPPSQVQWVPESVPCVRLEGRNSCQTQGSSCQPQGSSCQPQGQVGQLDCLPSGELQQQQGRGGGGGGSQGERGGGYWLVGLHRRDTGHGQAATAWLHLGLVKSVFNRPSVTGAVV